MLPVVLLFVVNFVFYTAYNKTSQKLNASMLADVFLLRRGLAHSLDELNKVLGLVGLSLIAWAFMSAEKENPDRDLWHALLVVVAHTTYSLFRYYGVDAQVPYLSTWPLVVSQLSSNSSAVRLHGFRKVATIMASLALSLLIAWWLPAFSAHFSFAKSPLRSLVFGYAIVAAALLHFVMMELDFKLVLRVRPFAYFPIFLSAATLLKQVFT